MITKLLAKVLIGLGLGAIKLATTHDWSKRVFLHEITPKQKLGIAGDLGDLADRLRADTYDRHLAGARKSPDRGE